MSRVMAALPGSFFVPDVEYLSDPQGLLGYVEEKVKLGHICLYCNGKGKTFHTYRALQQVCAPFLVSWPLRTEIW